jgi:hypothetical protein
LFLGSLSARLPLSSRRPTFFFFSYPVFKDRIAQGMGLGTRT